MDDKDKLKEPKDYELAVLIKDEAHLPAVAALVREHSGEMLADFRAKKLALAYAIKKETEAIFAYAHIRALGDAVKTLEHELNIRNDVLRSLLVLLPRPAKVREEVASHEAVTPVVPKRTSPTRSAPMPESRQSAGPLSNEALEKKIEEILK
jgi:ribosomal protein S6